MHIFLNLKTSSTLQAFDRNIISMFVLYVKVYQTLYWSINTYYLNPNYKTGLVSCYWGHYVAWSLPTRCGLYSHSGPVSRIKILLILKAHICFVIAGFFHGLKSYAKWMGQCHQNNNDILQLLYVSYWNSANNITDNNRRYAPLVMTQHTAV